MTVNLNVDENWFLQPYFALDYAFETMKKKRQRRHTEIEEGLAKRIIKRLS